MKKISIVFLLASGLISCGDEKNGSGSESPAKKEEKKEVNSPLDSLYNPEKFPFYHGVASGDPLQNAVIIWTRVTPEFVEDVVVNWKMASDSAMKKIIKTGKITTTLYQDFTVKIDVTGLQSGTVYYYQFEALDKKSEIGRTKTLPEKTEKIRLGFASCSNYEWGFFNAYRLMGEDSLDAVIHLGDYIYEYAPGTYDGKIKGRGHLPAKEIVTLEDYRTRYAQYRLDEDLQFVHAQHPFIAIWDDHELANNAYEEGAQNHNEGEGDWKQRLADAKKAYYEWMPIRENEGKHYRSFSFGDLANLIMIDTRTDGRTRQPESVDENNLDTSAHIIHPVQMKWLESELKENHSWKIIGNQILFSDIYVFFGKSPQRYNDGWSAYRKDQADLKRILESVSGTIFVTGDFHSSFGILNYIKNTDYDWIEFVVPSITSSNYDEDNGKDSALIYQKWYETKNEDKIFYSDLTHHGYFRLELTAEDCKGWFVYSGDILNRDPGYCFEKGFRFKKPIVMNKLLMIEILH